MERDDHFQFLGDKDDKDGDTFQVNHDYGVNLFILVTLTYSKNSAWINK